MSELKLAQNEGKHARRHTADHLPFSAKNFGIETSEEPIEDLLPRPRKAAAGSFAETAKLVTIDIRQRSSKKSLHNNHQVQDGSRDMLKGSSIEAAVQSQTKSRSLGKVGGGGGA